MSDLMTALTLLVAATFAVAAATKLHQHRRFAEELADYRLLPTRLVAPAALALPVAELGAVGLVCVPATRPLGAAAMVALLAVFSGAVAINLRRGNTEISCACFGAESQRLSIAIPGRNVSMVLPPAGGLAAGFVSSPSFSAMVAAAFAALLLTVTGHRG